MKRKIQFMLSILMFLMYVTNVFGKEHSNLECNATSNIINVLQSKYKTKKLKNIHQEAKVLMIIVDFETDKVEEDEQFFSKMIRNSDINAEGFHKFWQKITYGQKSIKHAEENWNTTDDGVIRVTLPYDLEHDGTYFIPFPQPALIADIIEKVSAYIDFPAFDVNGDGTIAGSELILSFVFPYNFRAGHYILPLQYNYGINLNMNMMIQSKLSNFSTFLHESGHALYNLHDIYGDYTAWFTERVNGLMRDNSDRLLSAYSVELLNLRVGTETNNDKMRLVEQGAPASEEGFRLYKVLSEDPEEYFLLRNIKGKLEITQRSPHYAKQIFYQAARKNTSSHDFQYVSGVNANISVQNIVNTGNIMTFDIQREVRTLTPAKMINPLFQRISSKKLDYFRWTDVGAEKYGLKVVFSFADGNEEVVYHNMDINNSFVNFDYDTGSTGKSESRELTATVTLSTLINNKWEEKIYYYVKNSKEDLLVPTSLLVRVADQKDDCSLELTWKDNAKNEIGYIITHNNSTIDTIPSDSESYILSLPKDGKDGKCKTTLVGVRAIGLKGLVSEKIETHYNQYSTALDIKSHIISPQWGSTVIPGETVTVTWKNYGAVRKKLEVSIRVNGSYVTIKEDTNIQGTSTNFTMPLVFQEGYVTLFSYNEKDAQVGYSQILLKLNTLQAVTNLEATNTTTNSATLTWTDNSDNETGFKVYRGSEEVAILEENIQSYTPTDLTPGTPYTYSVKAYNSDGTSSPSTTTFTTLILPTAPTNLEATNTTTNSATLTWTDNSDNETGFKIYRGSEEIDILGENIQSYTPTGLTPGTPYTYSVKAYNSDGTSSPSTTTFTTLILPTAPTNLQATNTTTNSATLTWTDNSDNETGFKVYRGSEEIDILRENIQSYALTGLTLGTPYTYSIKAYNTAGVSTASTTTFTTLILPTAPTNLQVTNITTNSATLTWTDTANNETEFKVYRGSTQIAILGENIQSYTRTGLTPGTPYTYSVRAYNSVGISQPTTTTFTTLSLPADAPDYRPTTTVYGGVVEGAGVHNFAFDIKVKEIDNGTYEASNPLILTIPKNNALNVSYDANLTTFKGQTVQNSDWSFDDSDSFEYTLTYTGSNFPSGGTSLFGFNGTITVAVGEVGKFLLEATIQRESGGDSNISNNSDRDTLQKRSP